MGGRKQSGGLRASIIFTTPAEELIFKHSNNQSPASAALLSQATIFFTCGNAMIFFLPAVHNFSSFLVIRAPLPPSAAEAVSPKRPPYPSPSSVKKRCFVMLKTEEEEERRNIHGDKY